MVDQLRGMLGLLFPLHVDGRAAQRERIRAERHVHDTGIGGRSCTHYQIESFLERIHRAVHEDNIESDGRIARLEFTEYFSEVERGHGGRRLDAQVPFNALRSRGGSADGLFEFCDQPHETRDQLLTGGSERQATRGAHNQVCPYLFFETRDPLRDYRGRDAQFPRGRGKTSDAGDQQKRIDVQQRVDVVLVLRKLIASFVRFSRLLFGATVF